MCTLSAMREHWGAQKPLFCPDDKLSNSPLCGNWPHHCLPKSIGTWGVPRDVARLNHYVTKEEAEWRAKCARPNPTFKGLSRHDKLYCSEEGMEAFLASISSSTDLTLFKGLDSFVEEVPPEFLLRAPLAPTAKQKLHLTCQQRQHSSGPLTTVEVLCSSSRGMSLMGDSDDVVCMYNCPLRKKARAVNGSLVHDKMGPVGRLGLSSRREGNCDCAQLELDSSREHRGRCTRRHDDKSYCWFRCCRYELPMPATRAQKWNATRRSY